MESSRVTSWDVIRAVMADRRCWRWFLRLALTPVVVSLFFPLYVLGAVAYSQFELQRALDLAPQDVLAELELDEVQLDSGASFGLAGVPVYLRYLKANGRTIVLLNAERRFMVEAPFVRDAEFQVVASSRRRLR